VTTPQALGAEEPDEPDDFAHQGPQARRPDQQVSGVTQLPVRLPPSFDLHGFREAVERRDLAYQLARYAADADIRIVDPDHPASEPRLLRGTSDILSWLVDSDESTLDVEVTNLIDGGDRFAFTQQWRTADGTAVVAVNTAELQDGLITTQHSILAWVRTWS